MCVVYICMLGGYRRCQFVQQFYQQNSFKEIVKNRLVPLPALCAYVYMLLYMKCRMNNGLLFVLIDSFAQRMQEEFVHSCISCFKTGRGGMYNCICSNGKIPFSFSVGIVCTFEHLLFYFVAWLLRLFSVFNVDFAFDYVLKSIKFVFI